MSEDGKTQSRTEVSRAVTEFYDELPFNFQEAGESAALIRKRNQVQSYPNLDTVLLQSRDLHVIDVGCGAGWFVNTVAYHYGLRVVGFDLSRVALARARETSVELEVADRTEFVCRNLFAGTDGREFDVVNSIGVLHHTHDLEAALAAVATAVKPDGFLHLGLYHSFGRAPFLELFERYRAKHRQGTLTEAELEEAFALYAELNPQVSSTQFLRSWFRDQVFHPHESQHTLKEVAGFLDKLDLTVESTSINRFEAFTNLGEVFELEEGLYEYSVEQNVRRRIYYPGFFTVLARRGSPTRAV